MSWTRGDSAPIAVDQTDALVPFSQGLEALAGQEVRVRLQLRNASLYSYWFASAADELSE